MSTTINIESLSKQQLQQLIHRGEHQLSILRAPPDLSDLVEDERIYSIVNDILLLAYRTGSTKAEVFTALAGALRQPMDKIAQLIPRIADDKTGGDVDEVSGHDSFTQASTTQGASPTRRTGTLTLNGNQEVPSARSIESSPERGARHRPQADKKSVAVYAHPVDRNKTWNGEGEMPKWLRDALSFGRKLEEFRM